MTALTRLAAGGFAATAIAFGPGRMGFGLFLPQFRTEFALSPLLAGLVSGAGFSAFLLALVLGYGLTARAGPRTAVLAGMAAAASGCALTAAASNPAMLSGGVALAMSSAGFAWSPYNAAVHDAVEDRARPLALSVISTGTSLGVAAAGGSALLLTWLEASWRLAWAGFAAAAAGALLLNACVMKPVRRRTRTDAEPPRRALARRAAGPLLLFGLLYGVTTSIFISFAADRAAAAGAATGAGSERLPALLFVVYGVSGLVGLGAARMKAVFGLAGLIRGVLLPASAMSLLLIALTPDRPGPVAAAAALQGGFVMTGSAVMAFWSERLFPDWPSLSFTAVLVAVASGSVAGPVAAGWALGHLPGAWVFSGAAALPALSALVFRPGLIDERAAPEPPSGGRSRSEDPQASRLAGLTRQRR